MKRLKIIKIILLVSSFSLFNSVYGESLHNKRLRLYQRQYQIDKEAKKVQKNIKNNKGKFANDLSLETLGLEKIFKKQQKKNQKIAKKNNLESPKNGKKIKEEIPLEKKYPLKKLDFDQLIYYHYLVSLSPMKEHNVRKEYKKAQDANDLPRLDGRYDNTFQREYQIKKKKFQEDIRKVLRNRQTTPESFEKYTLKRIQKYFPFMKDKKPQ